MDKPIAKERLKDLVPIPLNLSKHTDPQGEVYYRGNVQSRGTAEVDDLAARVAAKRSELRPETLAYAFANLKEEIYTALARGEAVDIGIGTLSLRMKGRFDTAFEEFDPDRHTFNIVFTPSLRARQLEEQLRGAKQPQSAQRQPALDNVCSADPTKADDAYRYRTVQPGSRFIHLYGRNIAIKGDHPDVGLCFRSESGEVVEVDAHDILTNTRSHLLVSVPEPLAEGAWTACLATQYNSSYVFYKEPKQTECAFRVEPVE